MPFRLLLPSWPEVLRQAADAELQAAETASQHLGAEQVHEIRKHCKRVRAWLRLLRPAVARESLDALEAHVRQAAQALGPLRDSHVMERSLHKLAERLGGDSGADASLRDEHVRQASALAAHLAPVAASADAAQLPQQVAAELAHARQALQALPLDGVDAAALERGLRQTYRSARRRWRKAQRQPSAENLHEWRKRSKALAYQSELLAPLWLTLGDMAGALDAVNDRLGDHHDLAVLQQRLEAIPDQAEPWRSLALQLQQQRERKALHAGAELLAVPPRRFPAAALSG